MSDRPPPRLRVADRQQVIPAMLLDNLLDTAHQARVVWEFCHGPDLGPLYEQIRSRQGGPGRAAIDPRLCLALWPYATPKGVGGARALAGLRAGQGAFRWVVGGVSVHHHTLSDFRVAPVELLDRLLTPSAAVLREQGPVDLNRVAHDGLRVRASAGAASFHRRPTPEECLHEAEGQVARLKEGLDDDPAAPSRRRAAARERAGRERAGRPRRALARLPELAARKKPADKDQARVPGTDPGATVMKMADGGFRPAYNIEYSADTAGPVTAAAAVTTRGRDAGQITPLNDRSHDRHGVYPNGAPAGGGLVSLGDTETAPAPRRGTQAYAPVPRPEDARRDGHQPLPGDDAQVRQGRQRMGTEPAKAIRRQRASTAACVNARARDRGLVRLLARGLRKVKAVALWSAVAHNLACGLRLRAGAAVAGRRRGKERARGARR